MSIVRQGLAAVKRERDTAEAQKNAWFSVAGSSENICRTVTKLCEALSKQCRNIFILFPLSNRLTKRFDFLF